VVPDAEPADPYAVTPRAFREQVRWLVDNGFSVVPLRSIVEQIGGSGGRGAARQAVLTFDDGYRNFATDALPVLGEFGLPATVFLATDMLGKTAAWNTWAKDVPLMTEEEVRAAAAQGVRFGSHTCTHADLMRLDDAELRRELEESRRRLSEFGETFFALSYPWGRRGPREVAAAKAAGYHCAVVVSDDPVCAGNDVFRLRRVVMRRGVDIPGFRRLVEGPGPRERIGELLRRAGRKLRGAAGRAS
jgi:peptidoglycan/xylan/chitin deacetylase (PgdA/CDA1 family)